MAGAAGGLDTGTKPRAVDISATIDRKIAALHCHRSQIGDPEQVTAWVRSRTAEQGEPFGFEYAETFDVISQGPGFHPDEQLEDVDLARAPMHPPAAPARTREQGGAPERSPR